MRIKEWWKWVNSKPVTLRWFIFFLLIRPLAELFYNLKDVSPLLSPLYWLGALTFIFSIAGIFEGKKIKSNLDKTFFIWATLAFGSVILTLFRAPGIIDYINFSIKLTTPVLLYYFLRVFIRNKVDFVGLFVTFLISCVVPVISMIIGITSERYFTEGRYSGFYADVFNHGFYLTFGTISLLYIYILNRYYSNILKIGNLILIGGLVAAFLGMWVIKHIATIAVFTGIMGIFFLIVSRKRVQSVLMIVFLSLFFVIFFGRNFYDEVINPRLEKEVEVIEGSRNIEQGMHGRMTRWTWLMGDFGSAPVLAQLMGYPYSLRPSYYMIGINPHNDFLRMLFYIGYVGLTVYVVLLVKVFNRIKLKDIPDKFLLYSTLLATVLYSLTTVPTFYPSFVNVLMMTFAYCALPGTRQIKNAQA